MTTVEVVHLKYRQVKFIVRVWLGIKLYFPYHWNNLIRAFKRGTIVNTCVFTWRILMKRVEPNIFRDLVRSWQTVWELKQFNDGRIILSILIIACVCTSRNRFCVRINGTFEIGPSARSSCTSSWFRIVFVRPSIPERVNRCTETVKYGRDSKWGDNSFRHSYALPLSRPRAVKKIGP